jgi:hypothetical protein
MSDLLLFAQQGPDGGDVLGGLGALACLYGLLGLLATVFWVWMLIDALLHEPTTNEKILWVLVIALLNLLGAIIYYFVRKRSRR